jgi:uncharacterized membrane protein
MLAALLYTLAALFWKKLPAPTQRWAQAALPLLALVGLGVAGYLSYIETQELPAVCGPVGDCNAVQASPYARLFGILPIGVLGMAGYLLILAAWAWHRLRRRQAVVSGAYDCLGDGAVRCALLALPDLPGAVCDPRRVPVVRYLSAHHDSNNDSCPFPGKKFREAGMLIENYDLEVFTPPCDPEAVRYAARARLTVDISEILPYLNATLRGAIYYPTANALTWKKGGHNVAFHAYEIAASNVEDREVQKRSSKG